jgi:hypothetical protein
LENIVKRTLGHGYAFHLNKAEWFFQCDRTRQKMDGTPDYRYNPNYYEVKRGDILCYIENVLKNWEVAESIMCSLPKNSPFINKTLSGSLRVKINDRSVSLFLREGQIINTKKEAIEYDYCFKKIYILAEEKQLRLYENDNLPLIEPNKVSEQMEKCSKLASQIKTPGINYEKVYKLTGVNIQKAKKEIEEICQKFNRLNIEFFSNTRHAEIVKIVLYGSPVSILAELESSILTLWKMKTRLFTDVIKCTGWSESLPNHWWAKGLPEIRTSQTHNLQASDIINVTHLSLHENPFGKQCDPLTLEIKSLSAISPRDGKAFTFKHLVATKEPMVCATCTTPFQERTLIGELIDYRLRNRGFCSVDCVREFEIKCELFLANPYPISEPPLLDVDDPENCPGCGKLQRGIGVKTIQLPGRAFCNKSCFVKWKAKCEVD